VYTASVVPVPPTMLSRFAARCSRSVITEVRVRRQLRAARRTRQSRCCHRTATVPSAAHVSIVSPLVNDVRHIAVALPRRSFETFICRRFRDWRTSGKRRWVEGFGRARLPCRRVSHSGLISDGPESVQQSRSRSARLRISGDPPTTARRHYGHDRLQGLGREARPARSGGQDRP
jgi:hypothetical protein